MPKAREKQAGASTYQEEISSCKGSSKITSTKEMQESKQEQEKHKVEKGQNEQEEKKRRKG